LNIEQVRIAKQAPVKIEFRAAVVPLQNQITERSRTGLELLLAAVGAVLLIACVNIANLLLARATSRRRELAIRSALGASSRDLVRQMLVESGMLALGGGAVGLAIAYAGVRLIIAYAPVDLPRMNEVHIDGRVLLFTLAISLLAALLSGVFPAWMFAKADPQEAMKAGSRGTTAASRAGRLRSALVAVEVALSAVSLIAGGLLLHSFAKLMGVNKGFQTAHVVTAHLALPYKRYPNTEKRAIFVRRLLDPVERIPGVQSVGISSALPLSGTGGNNLIFLPGVNVPLTGRPLADIRDVNPSYFRTLGIPMRAGRLFAETDGKHLVALVSAMAAKRLWPHEDPIGRVFSMGEAGRSPVQVVGVVGDVRAESLSKAPFLTVYLPYWQNFREAGSVVVKTKMEPLLASAEIRNVIRGIDPEMPIPEFRTMNDLVSDSVAQRRFQLQLILLFALAAILLASLGIYGVISFSVAQRTTEVGIRMALGAHPADIRGMILRQGLSPVFIGLSAGIIASLGVGHLLTSLLFGISPTDPVTAAGAIVFIGTVSAIAAYLPARRATRVDPATALRYE
jgi:putative ABC transport system permease protein